VGGWRHKRSAVRSLVGLVALACALFLAFQPGAATHAATGARPGPFVAVEGTDVNQTVGLFSATTGARLRRLGQFGLDFTNNGLAITPDDSAVFFTLIPRRQRSLNLMQLDVASDHYRRVARGEQPAVDNTGTELAFMTGADDVEVRDLRTGKTRRLDLTGVVDFDIDPLNSQLGWLADNQTLVMLPAQPAIADSTTSMSRPDGFTRCRPSKTDWPVVFIHVPQPGGRLTARCRTVRATASAPAPDGATVLAASPTDSSAVWIASYNGRVNTILSVGPSGPAQRIASLGKDVLPEAIDRASQHLLYISGHPPALWEATISRGRLTQRRKLVTHSQFAAAAW
jgi:hypothetical protein